MMEEIQLLIQVFGPVVVFSAILLGITLDILLAYYTGKGLKKLYRWIRGRFSCDKG